MHETWGPADETSADTIADTTRVRALLIAAARRREAMSYSELLIALGHRFTRPKMRAVCKTLDAIDAQGAVSGEPELAVLVVREADGLPGQGWWTGGRPLREATMGHGPGRRPRRLSACFRKVPSRIGRLPKRKRRIPEERGAEVGADRDQYRYSSLLNGRLRREVEAVRLLLAEFRQLGADLVEVECGDLLVEVLVK